MPLCNSYSAIYPTSKLMIKGHRLKKVANIVVKTLAHTNLFGLLNGPLQNFFLSLFSQFPCSQMLLIHFWLLAEQTSCNGRQQSQGKKAFGRTLSNHLLDDRHDHGDDCFQGRSLIVRTHHLHPPFRIRLPHQDSLCETPALMTTWKFSKSVAIMAMHGKMEWVRC